MAFDFRPYAVGGAQRPDTFTGLQEQFRNQLEQFYAAAPEEIRKQLKVTSGYRSPERQAGIISENARKYGIDRQAWERDVQAYGPVAAGERWKAKFKASGMSRMIARPGNSNHQRGTALDFEYVGPDAVKWAHANAPKFGLNFPMDHEDWHIEPAGARNASGMPQPLQVAQPGQAAAQGFVGGAAPTQQGFTGSASTLRPEQQAFVQSLMPAAMEVGQRTGLDPRLIIAQAAQETGWGKSAPGNNYFGIKSHGQGGGQNLTTQEEVNGQKVTIQDSFRTFATPGDSVAGYGDFITSNPRYQPLLAAKGLDAQVEALGASGYATDSNYAKNVGSIARSLSLDGLPANVTMANTQTVAPIMPNGMTDPTMMAEQAPTLGGAFANVFADMGEQMRQSPQQQAAAQAAEQQRKASLIASIEAPMTAPKLRQPTANAMSLMF